MSTTKSLREAAEHLGVHYMTAYRYVRLGMLRADKVGAAWRVPTSEVERFRTAGRASRHEAPWAERFARRLRAGDEAGAWSVIEAALTSGTAPADVYTTMLAPAMRQIGEEWHAGRLDIAAEHRASAIVGRIVGRLGPRMARRGRTKGVFVLGTAAGERHDLPLRMLADLVRGAGYDVVDLGCDLPPDSLADAVAVTDRLVAVGISSSSGGQRDRVAASVAAVRSRLPDVPVLLGGPGIDGAKEAEKLDGCRYASDAAACVAILDELVAG